MPSYHAMCRWNSGFFYLHPSLAAYDYYWRVEPDVHFFCDIVYDVFQFMRDQDLLYGFNMAILDDARSFASLWRRTREFMAANPDLLYRQEEQHHQWSGNTDTDTDTDEDDHLSWLLDGANGLEYNNCQFFSNFEIGSLGFFRGEANQRYFEYLDESGGFYYERYGDAPVHTLSVAMFAPKSKVWFFRDIGYQHDSARHCPPPSAFAHAPALHRCTCNPTSLDENFYKLVPMESPQVKPQDTCIRLWLGAKYLAKKDGWSQDVERAFGGDGYGGYLLDGMD